MNRELKIDLIVGFLEEKFGLEYVSRARAEQILNLAETFELESEYDPCGWSRPVSDKERIPLEDQISNLRDRVSKLEKWSGAE